MQSGAHDKILQQKMRAKWDLITTNLVQYCETYETAKTIKEKLNTLETNTLPFPEIDQINLIEEELIMPLCKYIGNKVSDI